MPLTTDSLSEICKNHAGVRARVDLVPLGGQGDKVFPPTYAVSDTAASKYPVETRMSSVDGQTQEVESVVLASVAAGAHRLKGALREAWDAEDLAMPLVGVDFDAVGLPEFGTLTDLETPHGVYDAIMRDSLDGDVPFRFGSVGQSVTTASVTNASALFANAPTALLTGAWDSTGPRGGLGNKFERAITAEIVATNIAKGVATSSRIDPLGIEKVADIYATGDGSWTVEKDEAAPKAKAMRPSEVNHGNVTPSIITKAGGITAERITATVVLSLIQLRRLKFPTAPDGSALTGEQRKEAEIAARATIAALGLAATALSFEAGFDLRSRCVLAPTANLKFEAVGRSGEVEEFALDGQSALDLVAECAARAASAGLPWRSGIHRLQPTDRLVDLVRRSQDARQEHSEA